MAAVTVHSDFGAQENKICHCFQWNIIQPLKEWSVHTRSSVRTHHAESKKPSTEGHVLSDFLSEKCPEQQIHADRGHSAVVQDQEEGTRERLPGSGRLLLR